MSRRSIFPLVLLFSVAPMTRAGGLQGSVVLMPFENDTFRSSGYAQYYNDLVQPDSSVTLDGVHGVNQVTPRIVYEAIVLVPGRYYYDLEGPAEPGACYGTYLHVMADPPGPQEFSQTWQGENRCAPPPPPAMPKDGPLPGSEIDLPYEGHTPIVIALNGRYEFTSVESGVPFDVDADGDVDQVAWPRDGSVAFLFHDRNGNGVPDDGGELFGNHTRLRNGAEAQHGFEALLEFDSNGDGAVSAADARWAQLGLWQDLDRDGVATHDELSALGERGISHLGLRYHWTGRRDAHGNILRWQSDVVREEPGPRPYYDVCLVTRAAS